MALVCPRCTAGELEEIEVGTVILDRCATCAGLWFDHDEIYELVDRRPAVREFEATIPAPESAREGMLCPRCQDVPLRPVEGLGCGTGRGVVVFRCASCSGTWMDRGALKEIQDPRIAEDVKAYFDKVCPG